MTIKFIALNVFLMIGSLLFLIFSSKINFRNQLFVKQKLSTFDGQLNHLADIGLYFALILIGVTSLIMSIRLTKHSVNPAVQPVVESAERLNAIIKNSIQHFFIFIGIYFYILKNDSFGLKWNHVSLFPFWFIISRIQLILSELIKIIFGENVDLSFFGKTLTFLYLGLMISQIGGIQLIKMI